MSEYDDYDDMVARIDRELADLGRAYGIGSPEHQSSIKMSPVESTWSFTGGVLTPDEIAAINRLVESKTGRPLFDPVRPATPDPRIVEGPSPRGIRLRR